MELATQSLGEDNYKCGWRLISLAKPSSACVPVNRGSRHMPYSLLFLSSKHFKACFFAHILLESHANVFWSHDLTYQCVLVT